MLNTQNKRIVPSSLEDIRPPRHHIPSYRPFHPPQPHPSTHQNPPNCEEAPPALILIQSVRSIINPLLLLIIRSSPSTTPPQPDLPFLTPQPKSTMPPQPFLQFWVLMAIIVGFAIVIVTAGVLYYHLVHRKRAARSRAFAESRVDAGAVREGRREEGGQGA